MSVEPQPAREKKQLVEIADRLPEFHRPGPSTYLEWKGTTQMAVLLAVICTLAVGIFIAWAVTQPTLDDIKALTQAVGGDGKNLAPMTPKEMAELLSTLQRDHSERYRHVFQLVVLSGLVPLFTLLAGYVFGRGKGAPQTADGGDDDS